MAVIFTDVLQCIIMIVGAIVLAIISKSLVFNDVLNRLLDIKIVL